MLKKAAIVICMGGIVLLPFLFRGTKEEAIDNGEDKLVIITAHTNSLRTEVSRGFKKWYKEKTGRTISLDWRDPGGANEIIKYLDAIYTNAFRMHWTNDLGNSWNSDAQKAYKDPELSMDEHPARKAFLESNITSDIDVWYGGGLINFTRQTTVGLLVDSKMQSLHPDWFNAQVIPNYFAGSPLYDTQGRWYGTTFSTFGIVYNEELLRNIGFNRKPTTWDDLAQPIFFGEVAIADPGKSGSFHKTLEGIVQQEIQKLYRKIDNIKEDGVTDEQLAEIIEAGWENALKVIQRIAANARIFAKRSSKAILDIASGNSAIGVAVDYYAYTHAINLEERNESKRLGFILPKGETIPTPDCIGLLRGAPHKKPALLFIEFILSLEGQSLSAFNKDAPGGPQEYVLCRSSIRRDFYKDTEPSNRFDPEINPYIAGEGVTYEPEWTATVFNPLKFIMKSAFINTHKELQGAWKAIINAQNDGRTRDAEAALKVFDTFEAFNYKEASGRIYNALKSKEPLEQILLETELTYAAIAKYKKVQRLAGGLR